ncbi:glycosyltransferase family 2 protein [Paenibacillus sp. IHBB 10380]|uniref:glycosyltransferase family 2 protein n=1 Tax=Paenibacillus sp. IHBB 10380 TaxID=1566358 RepID=UPI0005CFA2A3|nr:glycosyltransferase family 2 protein [Paenibacillus sp. IHBB 10380]AJS60040.1 glycosyl transferase family 2 [Paenibacillus sp. IHBB 10380]
MIDVIVPIYKGIEETKECIQSLLTCPNKVEHRFILINDHSPEKEINEYLSELDDGRIILLENEKNLGFVKTANRGMKYADNDVILLNSDTVVTDNWIDKLHAAACSNPRIGTVTTLTNNGTIASVPSFNKDNELPQGYTIQQFSNLVEYISNKHYPVIPTGVGHGLYIKRTVIHLIGYLDEQTFGMGYGEEVDFSYRVIKKGYINILADDTFIYHYGSTSFKEDKIQLVNKNKKKLRKKYLWSRLKLKYFMLFNNDAKRVGLRIQNELKRVNYRGNYEKAR